MFYPVSTLNGFYWILNSLDYFWITFQWCATIKLSICPPQNRYTSQIPVYLRVVFVVVFQLLSPVRLFATAWIAASQAPLSFTISQSLCKLMSTVDDAIQPSHPLLLLSSAFPSRSLFQCVCSLHQVAKVLVLRLQQQSFQWVFRVDSFRTDWFDSLAVQGTLKSLLQHHSSKALWFGKKDN